MIELKRAYEPCRSPKTPTNSGINNIAAVRLTCHDI
jgi:hypothetical protein